jgi:hypothetical protein
MFSLHIKLIYEVFNVVFAWFAMANYYISFVSKFTGWDASADLHQVISANSLEDPSLDLPYI